jgi:hypothetical protein
VAAQHRTVCGRAAHSPRNTPERRLSIYSRAVLAALVLLAASALLVAARALDDRSALERAMAAALLFPAFVIGLVELLSPFGLIGAIPFLVGAGALMLAALALAGDDGRDAIWGDLLALRDTLTEIARQPIRLAACGVGLTSITLAILASYLLVPWSWDGLGYHLPFAFDAITEGTLRPVASSAPYVNTYPHLGDVFLIGYRLSLLDGTFVELVQLAYVPLLVLAIASWARRAGVPTGRALSLGMLVLALPAVALQLAANYVDVIYAALAVATFVYATGPMDPRSLALFAVAAGLTLGTKPSAPPLVTLACLVVLVRAGRRGRIGDAVLACVGVVAIGAWKYVENLARFGNPIWPVSIELGPIHVHGLATMGEIAGMGLLPPMRDSGWLARIFASWTTVFPDRYVYDMRVGGFGPLFALVLVPAAIASIVAAIRSTRFRSRARVVAIGVGLLAAATLATPGAYWARYTLAVPSALLVLALASSEAVTPRVRAIGDALAVIAASVGLLLAVPGYTVGGPSLAAMMTMSPDEREHAYGADSYEGRFADVRALVGRGESALYDRGFGLAGRLYPLDGRARIEYVADDPATADELIALVDREHARIIAVTEPPVRPTADLARSRPDRFRFLFGYPDADGAPCGLFEVLPRSHAGSTTPP